LTRIVSLTPSRIDRDTRTFKEAASFARHGMESVVVEGVASGVEPERLPFQLHGTGSSIQAEAPAGARVVGARTSVRGAWRKLPRRLTDGVERTLRTPLTIYGYLAAARATADSLPAAELYWLHGYHQFPTAWLAARRRRAPLLYDAHDFYPEVIEGGDGTRIDRAVMRWFYLAIERRCVHSAAEVVTVSDGVADLIARRTGRRPVVVRNCAEVRGMAVDGPDVRTAAGVAPDDFLVVMPGNHKTGMRAVDEAVEAFATLPARAHLAFVGDGYQATAEEVERRGLGDRIHLLPAVAGADVPAFIRTADAVAVLYVPIMSAIEFALPNGFFSAIAAGLPLLWPRNLPEIRRLAQEHDLGVPIEPLEPASIAAAVHDLLEHPDRVAALRANVERARDVLNWEVEERGLLDIVARLTNGRG
jgi:glycosyltransferase involved in cell wall biosynthesis